MMKMKHCGLLGLMVVLGSAATLRGEAIALSRDGEPAAAIVVAQGAGEKVTQAAQDLRRYIAAIGGVTLPLHTDGRKVQGTGLYIGNCAITTTDDLPPKSANPETYAIRVRDGNVLMTAAHPTPTAFAVYALIEDVLGVRWFAPRDLWEHVPARVKGDYVIDVENAVVTPTTSPRIWSGHYWFENWKRWNTRNKADQSEVVPRRQFQNILHKVLPPSVYAKEHPEYYPLIDGKRWIPPDDNAQLWRPCQTNPDVMRITVEFARKWLDENPTVDSFSMGMDDINRVCGCDDCRALDANADAYEKKQFADRYYKFVNAFARELAKTHPDRYVGTLIYHIARKLPQTVDKLEPNVFGFITETSAQWWQPGLREKDQALTAAWAKRCQHLSRYDYFGMGTFTPRVYPHWMDQQLKYDKSLGFEGCYIEMYTFLPHTAPMIWAFAKLQWDHTLNIDDLLGEFYAKMYGPAAANMKQYFDALEASWMENRPGRDTDWVHSNVLAQAQSVTPQTVDRCLALLDDATAAANGDEKIAKRIDIHRGALRFAGYAIKAQGLTEKLTQLQVTDEASAEQALKWIEQMAQLAGERERDWPAAFERDDLLGENLRGLRKQKYLQIGRVGVLETGSTTGALRVLAWYGEHRPGQLKTITQRMSQSVRGSVAATIRGWLYVQEHKPPNRLTNGDFETRGENQAAPQEDWSTQGAPVGWQTWSGDGQTTFGLRGGAGRGGSTAGVISEADSSSVFLQIVPAKSGERYVVICWTKSDPPGADMSLQLVVRYRDEADAWFKHEELEPMIRADANEPGWQPLILALTVPDGVGGLVIMPYGSGGKPGAALFDDVGVYRVER